MWQLEEEELGRGDRDGGGQQTDSRQQTADDDDDDDDNRPTDNRPTDRQADRQTDRQKQEAAGNALGTHTQKRSLPQPNSKSSITHPVHLRTTVARSPRASR